MYQNEIKGTFFVLVIFCSRHFDRRADRSGIVKEFQNNSKTIWFLLSEFFKNSWSRRLRLIIECNRRNHFWRIIRILVHFCFLFFKYQCTYCFKNISENVSKCINLSMLLWKIFTPIFVYLPSLDFLTPNTNWK